MDIFIDTHVFLFDALIDSKLHVKHQVIKGRVTKYAWNYPKTSQADLACNTSKGLLTWLGL